jgi:hypothetical protein
MFIPHRKHTYGPPRHATGIALLCIGRYVRTSQVTYLWIPGLVTGTALLILFCGKEEFVDCHVLSEMKNNVFGFAMK